MNAREIRARRDEVNRAPVLPRDERIEVLCELFDRWREPGGRWQRALCDALRDRSGFHPATLREGVRLGFGAFSGCALRELEKRELAGKRDALGSVSTVLAGAIPMPTLVAITSPLLTGASLLLKMSHADPVSAPLVLESLQELSPSLARRAAVVELANDDAEAMGALMDADCVELTGSDESVERFARYAGGTTRVLRHGHRFSAALVGPAAAQGEALERFATDLSLDIALWDQLGCLSPVALFVCDPDRGAAARVAEALAKALARRATEFPRTVLGLPSRASFHDAIDVAVLRGATTLSPESRDWCVVLEDDAQVRESPLYRFIRVHPCRATDEALGALRDKQRHLAALAVAGFGDGEAALTQRLSELGASRVCAVGSLQRPPLAWPRDGIPVLEGFLECGRESA